MGKENFAHDYETFLSLGEPDEMRVEIGENDPQKLLKRQSRMDGSTPEIWLM